MNAADRNRPVPSTFNTNMLAADAAVAAGTKVATTVAAVAGATEAAVDWLEVFEHRDAAAGYLPVTSAVHED